MNWIIKRLIEKGVMERKPIPQELMKRLTKKSKERQMKPRCRGCGRHPDQIDEYIAAAADCDPPITPDQYVQEEEGTYNHETGGFLCTECYIKAGMPTAPYPGWKAP